MHWNRTYSWRYNVYITFKNSSGWQVLDLGKTVVGVWKEEVGIEAFALKGDFFFKFGEKGRGHRCTWAYYSSHADVCIQLWNNKMVS